MKTDRLGKHGWLLYYYLFEKFGHPKMVNEIKQLMNAKHNRTTLEDIFSVVILLLFVLFIYANVLIIEIVYFAYTKKFPNRDGNEYSK